MSRTCVRKEKSKIPCSEIRRLKTLFLKCHLFVCFRLFSDSELLLLSEMLHCRE